MDYPKSVPSVGLVNGKFVDEDPGAGTPGSLIPSAWGNAVTDEILAVISDAGLTPDEENHGQLKEALNRRDASAAATQAEAEAGTDNAKRMTPLRVFQAIAKVVKQSTESAFGWAKVATQAQVTTGTDDTTIITPKKLRAAQATQVEAEAGTDNAKVMTPLRVYQAIAKVVTQATEAAFGWAKVATQAQIDAGEADDVIVTPKKLRWGFNAIWGVNGGIAFPSWLGGWIVNWGLQASALSGTISYPIAYTTRAYGIQGQYTHATPSNVNHNITFKDLALSGLSSVPFVSGIANQFQWWGFGK